MLWDPHSGAHLQTLSGHTSFVEGLAFHPDGTALVSVGNDWQVRLWRVSQQSGPWGTWGHVNTPAAVDVSGQTVATAGFDGRLITWDVLSGRPHRSQKEYAEAVRALRFHPRQNLAASGAEEGLIRLWNPADGSTVRALAGHTRYVKHLSFSPNGSRLASASLDGTVRLWDPDRGLELKRYDALSLQPQKVYFRPGHSELLVMTSERSALLVDLESERYARLHPSSRWWVRPSKAMGLCSLSRQRGGQCT